MPPAIRPPLLTHEVVEIVIHSRLYEQQIFNVLHYNSSVDLAAIDVPAHMVALAANFVTEFQTPLWSVVAADMVFEKVSVRSLTHPLSVPYDWTFAIPATTSRSGEALPTQVAAVLKKKTAFRSRAALGRFYLAGCSQSDIVDGRFRDALNTPMNALLSSIEDVLDGAEDVTFVPVVISKKNSDFQIPPLIYGARVEHCTWDRVPGVQRRRRIGTGI